jgi:hypothetical protein
LISARLAATAAASGGTQLPLPFTKHKRQQS